MFMGQKKLAEVESRFADILWEHVPVSTKKLIQLCEKELNWKRTTTYTVLKKLCQREIFQMEDGMVTALLSRDDFYAIRSEQFVDKNFDGSLPSFIAAFASRKQLSAQEIAEIRALIDRFEG